MIRCLSFHAPYRCRHAGACCRAGWTIAFDPVEYARARRLAGTRGTFVRLRDGGATAARQDDGICTFFDTDSGLCGIHRAGGHAALPLACRMFPRSVLHDPRGTFVSLSHFCPTAAALLFEPGPPAAIVDAPAALADVGPLDGLDAREAWPPLLRPGVLMDVESYGAWERQGIDLLTRDGVPARDSLAALEDVTTRIARWSPGEPLGRVVHDAFERAAPGAAALASHDAAVKRWLAARLFACWVAYQGHGLAAIVGHLRKCLTIFTLELARDDNPLEAIRRSDLQIMHAP
ncbi:MAG TPA: YkgJ family cysteine cluster protein [Vicinamibacterales bacterium]|nr:YkgJ family cysteine cluster protein [Vicinamibacterales bacterium]